MATNRTLSPEATQAQRNLSAGYLSWFEKSGLPLVKEQTLETIGTQLFEAWLTDDWADVQDEISPTARRHFVVASDVPAVLNLPWSLLRLPDEDEPLGLDPTSSVRLHPATERLAESHDDWRPGPLRVLYSACAPRDAGDLGWEREEHRLLQTLTQAGRDVAHFGCDLGAFDELQDRVREYRPHVVHLTGHGVVHEGEGHFAFEDEEGYMDLRPGDQIVNDALAGRGVQCVFVSGCETGQAPEVEAINGLCQDLVTNGVPLSVGWAASILDDVATEFGNTFYAELSAGESVDRAVVQARRDARRLCTKRVEKEGVVDPSWTLPVLYTATTQANLFDPARHEEPPKPTVEQRPLPGMTEGHANYFIGRRREQQRLLPDLRNGDLNTVLLTGLGGMGKSTLATRLARALQKDGFTPIAVPSKEDEPLTAGRLLDRCYEAFLAEDVDDGYQRLRGEEIDLRDKLRLLVRLLNRNQFVLVLDNFEQNVDRDTREILNDDLAWFLPYLVENLTGASRCLVTTRYRPADLGDDLPPVATERSLTDFPESAFFKYLLDDEVVRRRYRSGDLPRELLSQVYDLLGGTPRFLEQVREVLRDMPADELESALDTVDLPEDVEENRLREIRDEYVQDLFVDQLYGAIEPPEAREALSRAAVYTVPMTAEGYAAAVDVDVADVRDWLDEWRRPTFVAPVRTDDSDTERWIVPTLLRPWLLDRIGENERREAHQAAGEWLMEIITAGQVEVKRDKQLLETVLEARSRILDAGNYEHARGITHRWSKIFMQRGIYDQVLRFNEEMLEYERHPIHMKWIGRVHLERGEFEEAHERFEQALRTYQEIGDRSGETSVRHQLATIALEQEDYKNARKEFEEVLRTSQEIGDRSKEVKTRGNLAAMALKQGDYKGAREGFEEVLQVCREIGNRSGEATTRLNLGSITLERGNYEEARGEFEKALQIYREIRDRGGEASTGSNLATMVMGVKDNVTAQEEFGEAFEIRREISNRSGEALTRRQLAMTALEQEDYEKAQEELDEALQIHQEIEDWRGEALTRRQLAAVTLEHRGYEEARSEFEEALQIYREIGDWRREVSARQNLATVAAVKENYEEAWMEFEELLQIHQETGDRDEEASTRHNLATIALKQGEYREAWEGFEEVLQICQEIGNRSGEAMTFMQFGKLLRELGDTQQALRLYLLASRILAASESSQQQTVWTHVSSLASKLELSKDDLEAVAQEVEENYDEYRGWSLIQEAFPDADIPDDVPPLSDSE